MRDRGFDYYWSDKYCENLVAVGFESRPDTEYDAVSAFEVLEHVADPVTFLADAIEQTGCKTIILSTELFSGTPPLPNEWWYYAFDGGQHISFYQKRTLCALAGRLGLKPFTNGSIHVLTDKHLAPLTFRLRTDKRIALILSTISRVLRKSMTMSDHIQLKGR